jgi:hypothetical protein
MFKQPISTILFFVLIWLGISMLLGFLSGWFNLSSRFQAKQKVTGDNFRFVSGRMGFFGWIPVNYSSCFLLTVADTGFKLSIFFPLKHFQSPLFIPWQQVKSVVLEEGAFLDSAVICVHQSAVRIQIFGRPGKSLIKAFETFSAQQVSNSEHSTDDGLEYE